VILLELAERIHGGGPPRRVSSTAGMRSSTCRAPPCCGPDRRFIFNSSIPPQAGNVARASILIAIPHLQSIGVQIHQRSRPEHTRAWLLRCRIRMRSTSHIDWPRAQVATRGIEWRAPENTSPDDPLTAALPAPSRNRRAAVQRKPFRAWRGLDQLYPRGRLFLHAGRKAK